MAKRADLNKKMQEEFAKYTELFKGMKEQEAKDYIQKNVYKVKISKELIAAYVKTYHSKKEEQAWLQNAVIAKKKYKNVADTVNGEIQYTGKVHKKTGEKLYKTKKVYTGETAEPKFDTPTARNLFLKEYDITPKPTGFAAKEAAEPLFDAMADLL